MLHRPQSVIRLATRDEIPRIADLIVASLEPFRAVVRAQILDLYIEHSRDVEGRWDCGDVLVIESNGKNDAVIAGLISYNWPRTASITLQAAVTMAMLVHVFGEA